MQHRLECVGASRRGSSHHHACALRACCAAESPIAQVLEAEGLLDEATRRELAQVCDMWALEAAYLCFSFLLIQQPVARHE